MQKDLTVIEIKDCPNPQAFTVHTRFNVQNNPALKIILEQIEGVEVVRMLYKYEFTVLVGQLFDKQEIVVAIQQKIKDFCEE